MNTPILMLSAYMISLCVFCLSGSTWLRGQSKYQLEISTEAYQRFSSSKVHAREPINDVSWFYLWFYFSIILLKSRHHLFVQLQIKSYEDLASFETAHVVRMHRFAKLSPSQTVSWLTIAIWLAQSSHFIELMFCECLG